METKMDRKARPDLDAERSFRMKHLQRYECPRCEQWCYALWRTKLGPACSRCVREVEAEKGENVTTFKAKKEYRAVVVDCHI